MNIQDVLDRVRPGNIYDFHLSGYESGKVMRFIPMDISMPDESIIVITDPSGRTIKMDYTPSISHNGQTYPERIIVDLDEDIRMRLWGITLVQEVK